jgi:serine/threonine protein kinase
VKPGNLFVVAENGGECAKLLDFGIAMLPPSSKQRTKLTRPGAIFGTPEYMAPEQLLGGDEVDGRADVYSLAATAYECLSGRVPFDADCQTLLLRHSRGDRPALLTSLVPEVPLPVAHAIDRALMTNPRHRYSDVDAFTSVLVESSGVDPGPLSLLGTVPVTAQTRLRPTKTADPSPVDIVHDLVMKRKFPRAPYLTPVRVLDSERTAVFDGRSQDISEGGMQLGLSSAIASGTKVVLKFALPMTARLVAAPGVVRWCKEARGGQYTIGVSFDGSVEDASVTVRRYVAWFGTASDG